MQWEAIKDNSLSSRSGGKGECMLFLM